MEFIVLVRTDGKPVIVNLNNVAAIYECENYSSLIFTNILNQKIFEIHVVESMSEICQLMDKSFGVE